MGFPTPSIFGSLLLIVALTPLQSQISSHLQQELERIFEAREYRTESFGPARWLEGGASYTTLEPSSIEEAKDIVQYDTESGQRSILVAASRLAPQGESKPLSIQDYAWSEDRNRLLIFTNTKKVWRRNTRGDYWVLDLKDDKLRKLGGTAPEASLMFAKFSPQGDRVAYVRRNNLYVEEIADGKIQALTQDGSETIINGTSDWVYEEEFGVRDGFRWSPDGSKIAFWNFDSEGVQQFSLINNTDTLYPQITTIPYPKAGTTNSAVRVGVVSASGGPVRWMQVKGDPRNQYIARMDWADDRTLVMQHLNRLQNRNDVLLANVADGKTRRAYRDQSESWVDVVDEVHWLKGGSEFVWISEQDGWRHLYRVEKRSGQAHLITTFEADLIQFRGTDPQGDWAYFLASPENATQRYLYRSPIDGSGAPQRLTPADQPGTHSYQLSPDCRWAFHTYSRFDQPPVIDLVRLPRHQSIRVLAGNQALRSKLAERPQRPVEFLSLKIESGHSLDAWMIKPNDFDSSRKYPLLIFVYGEPAGQTVLDRWGGDRMLFHRALAGEGFVVASIDNRGTPAPKGAAWRKVIYGTVGELSSREQAAAVRLLLKRFSFLDADRVGIWGWSGGGSNTLNAMFRYPEVFKVGVSVAPVPDQRLYDTIYQERYMGLPQQNEEGYRIGSPIHFAEGLSGRLLIVHGTGDDNVHCQGTERLVNRLIELGKRFDLMVYPNRSHSISEGSGTRVHIYTLTARYLVEALL